MLAVGSLCSAICLIALALHALGVWATLRHTRQARFQLSEFPALTLLKPIKGDEESLEDNLRSFFEQQYPAPLSFVFSSTDPADPGILVARRVARAYPEATVQFVLSETTFGYNPKVSNLAGALAVAEHDLVLQTDANVRLRAGYLRAAVAEYLGREASLMGALVAGVGERSLGAALENVQLTTFITPGICLAYRIFKIPCVIGKSILFRKSELESLGGLARVKDVLAEDFVLGEVYGRAGKRVVLSALAVDNINIAGGLSRFASRHIRWLQMRVVVHVLGFLADLGSNAAFFALVAAAWSGASEDWARYVGVVLYKGAIDAWLLAHIRGRGLALRHLPALALRDLLQPAMWLVALFSRTTEWRGARFRLLKGSRLEPLPRRSVLAPPPVAVSELVPSSPPTPGPQQVEHRG